MPIPHHETNRASWNRATRAHNSHRGDQAAAFRQGHNSLYQEETRLLGNLTGRRVAHLMCNCGQDTLSIKAHLKPASILGVDISDEAVDFARNLVRDTGIEADFLRADIFTWFDEFDPAGDALFDTVFMSYGTLCWLSDIRRWARGVAKTLKPGARLVLIDFHSMMTMFETGWTPQYPALGGRHVHSPGVGDYIGESYDEYGGAAQAGEENEGESQSKNEAHEYAWGLGDVLSALLEAGLRLEHIAEHDHCNGWKMAPDMRVLQAWHDAGIPKQIVTMPEDKPAIAMMYSVVAVK
jgi:SAM-dependent methyltransferase